MLQRISEREYEHEKARHDAELRRNKAEQRRVAQDVARGSATVAERKHLIHLFDIERDLLGEWAIFEAQYQRQEWVDADWYESRISQMQGDA